MPITKLMEGLPNQSMNQADFDAATAKYMSELPAWGVEANALATDVNAKQQAAANSATESEASRAASAVQAGNSAASAGTASTQAGIATDKATVATNKASEAAGSAQAAAQSVVDAGVAASGMKASSTSSVVAGNGSKAFSVGPGKQFGNGDYVAIVYRATPALKMFGTVDTYASGVLTVIVTHTEGSGTGNDWSITPGGETGPQGGTAGGQLTSALDEKKGNDLASASTIDPWSTGGNSMNLTGNVTITGIVNAPQPGAKRTLLVTGAPPIIASANLMVKGGSLTLAAGDEVDIEAIESVSKFRVTVRRGDGTAVIPLVYRNSAFITTSQTFIAKVTGPHRIVANGACGSGAVATLFSPGGGKSALASGGAPGGTAVKTVNLVVGDAVVIALGVGGASVFKTANSDGGVVGNPGTASTITGPGFSITVNGGQGGKFAVGVGAMTAASAIGGTATGGDYNYKGGDSGAVSSVGSFGSGGHAIGASGGAACSYSGSVFNSGNVTITGNSSGATYFAGSGGASPGGKSGNVTVNGSSGSTGSGGAGALGSSADVTTGNGAGGVGVPAGVTLTQIPLTLTGAGSDSTSTNAGSNVPAGAGAGSGAVVNPSLGNGTSAAIVLLGGTGACVANDGGATSGRAWYGASSGGAVLVNTGSNSNATSGSAGAPTVTIEWP